jgi:catechol 2,3-dioxygenase-like lactoylglutathione lyase family enzyme
MTTAPAEEPISHRWYTRPVFFVSDVQRALRFYIDKLGFEKQWHSGDGAGKVCQVGHGECEIILCEEATRRDKSRLFVELTREGLDELRREIAERPCRYKRRGGAMIRFESRTLTATNCSFLWRCKALISTDTCDGFLS